MPTLGATINNEQAATVSQGANVTLRVNTASVTPLSAPTSLTMACAGANAGINPFNRTNLDSIAGLDHTYPAVAAVNAGSTSCTLVASNAAGTVTYQVSFNATPTVVTPRPTISASFDPNRNFTAGSAIWLNLSATNASSVRWSCSGRWNHSNQAIGVGRTRHTTPNNAGSTNCTFTATGPGGTSSTTAGWTSVAAGGGGSGTPETGGTRVHCAAQTISLRAQTYECYSGRNYCTYNIPALTHGATTTRSGGWADYCGGGAEANATVQCNNGTLVVRSYRCNMWDGGG